MRGFIIFNSDYFNHLFYAMKYRTLIFILIFLLIGLSFDDRKRFNSKHSATELTPEVVETLSLISSKGSKKGAKDQYARRNRLLTSKAYAELLKPAGFLENKGQFAEDFKFVLERWGLKVFLNTNSFTYQMIYTRTTDRGREVIYDPITLTLEGANSKPTILKVGESKDIRNYFTAAGKITHVHHYQQVLYRNIYPDIDILFESYESERQSFGVKYSFIIYPGGDPDRIKILYSGQDDLSLPNPKADSESPSLLASNPPLYLEAKGGTIGEKIDAIYTLDNEDKIAVEGSYKLDENSASFKIGTYDKRKILVIDPSIIRVRLRRATYYGSEGSDRLNAVTADNSDNIYAVGATAGKTVRMSKSGAFQEHPSYTASIGNDDIIIAKFSSDLKSLLSATYWTSNANEEGFAIDLDNNAVYVGGFIGNSDSKEMLLGSFKNNLTRLNWSKRFGSGGSSNTEQINDLVTEGDDILPLEQRKLRIYKR